MVKVLHDFNFAYHLSLKPVSTLTHFLKIVAQCARSLFEVAKYNFKCVINLLSFVNQTFNRLLEQSKTISSNLRKVKCDFIKLFVSSTSVHNKLSETFVFTEKSIGLYLISSSISKLGKKYDSIFLLNMS